MNKVTVNETYAFDIHKLDEVLSVNEEQILLDTLFIDDHKRHIIYNNQSYSVELVDLDKVEKKATIKVNGSSYQVKITTPLDLLLKQLGMDNLAASKVLQLKAPMPGLVLSVLVKEGQEVVKGESLLILEAMKMENIIKSPTDGTVQRIEVAQGDKIEKNTVLIKFA